MAPVEIHSHAVENLRFIRDTMERASSFTAVPGRGGILMGVTALIAALIASGQPTAEQWLSVWAAEAVLAVTIGLYAMAMKARETAIPLWSAPARKFAFAFAPPIAVAALLTAAIVPAGLTELLPGIWLLLYGVAVIGAGSFSPPTVRLMGVGFLIVGAIALFARPGTGDIWLAAGFGGLHIVFGFLIARRFGG